jgi:tripartite-type tricarboxylate transporter receptor subunit TctC
LSFLLNPSVQAQRKYPNKPITFIVPFGPGGASDLCWRVVLEDLRAELGVSINALNKAGAGGLSGADIVATAKPDGYTLLAANNTCMTVAPAIDPKAYRDLVPIAVVANQGLLIATRSNHEIKTLEEMISRAKAKPDSLTVGSTGVTASTYFDLALLEVASGTSFSHVPIPSSNEGTANLLGGHIDFWFGTFSATQNLMMAGRLRGLATALSQRLPAFPDIPTFAERGYPDVNLNLDMILYGPKGTPPEVIKVWEDALKAVIKKPSMKAALAKVNFEVDFKVGSEKIRRSLDQTRENLIKIVKVKGLKPE